MPHYILLAATVLGALLGGAGAVDCPSAWAKLPDLEGEGCESYYQCDDWEPKKSWCSSGYQFSFDQMECMPDEDVWCAHQIEQYWSSHSDDHHDYDHHHDYDDHHHDYDDHHHDYDDHGDDHHGDYGGSSSSSSSSGGDHHDSHTITTSTGEHSHRSTLTHSSESGDKWEEEYDYKYEYVPDPNYEYVYEYAYSDPWLKSQTGSSSSSSSHSSPSSSSHPSSSHYPASSSSSRSSSGHGSSSCSSSSPRVIPFPVPVSAHSLLSSLGGLQGLGSFGSIDLSSLGGYGMLSSMREAPGPAPQAGVQQRREGNGPRLLPVALRPRAAGAELSRQELLPEDARGGAAENPEPQPEEERLEQGGTASPPATGVGNHEAPVQAPGSEKVGTPPLGTPSPRELPEEQTPGFGNPATSRPPGESGVLPAREPNPTPNDPSVLEAGTETPSQGFPPDEEPESPEEPSFVEHGPETAEELPPGADNSEGGNPTAGDSQVSSLRSSDVTDNVGGDFWFQEGHGDILPPSEDDVMTSRSHFDLLHHVIPSSPQTGDALPREAEGSTPQPSVPKFLV